MGNVNNTEALNKKPLETQLLYASENGDFERVKRIIGEAEVPVDVENSSALTPLFLAAKEGHEDCLRILIEAGARVDGVGCDNTALTPIWVATYAGHDRCVQLLIEAGASLNSRHPETPLYIAAREHRTKCLEILINAGASVNTMNNHRQTPLHIACAEMHVEGISLLVEAGCNLDATDLLGHTPLLHACLNAVEDGHKSIEILVKAGASVNLACQRCDTASPLHTCAQRGKIQSLKTLLDYGANVFLKDKLGLTARHRTKQHEECEKVLREKEALPPSLLFLCKWKLRKLLGAKRLRHITELPLPRTLRQFLL